MILDRRAKGTTLERDAEPLPAKTALEVGKPRRWRDWRAQDHRQVLPVNEDALTEGRPSNGTQGCPPSTCAMSCIPGGVAAEGLRDLLRVVIDVDGPAPGPCDRGGVIMELAAAP